MLYKGYWIIKTKIQEYHKHPSKVISGLLPFPPSPVDDLSLVNLTRYHHPAEPHSALPSNKVRVLSLAQCPIGKNNIFIQMRSHLNI